MKLYEAIRKMRELTERNEPFSLTYVSYNSTNGTSEGVVEVRRALLRKRSTKNSQGEYILQYYDTLANADRQFYFPLLLSLNNQAISHEH